MISPFEKDLFKIAVFGRFLVWLISFASDHLIEDHDHSVELLFTTKEKPQLSMISHLLRCFVRWDSLFYVSIAENKYEYLKNHAFFPFYSNIIRFTTDIVFSPFPGIKRLDALILTGVTFNLILHLANVLIFYKLSIVYLKNEALARKSALLYVMSPASIFFSAFYTESIFCFFTFLGYHFLYKDESYSIKNIIYSTIFFGLSGFIRSNGNFYILLIGYKLLHRLVEFVIQKNINIKSKIKEGLKIIVTGVIILVSMNIPYFIVMRTPYKTYCVDFESYEFAEKPKFCQSLLPNAYTYIQDKFWDVGFLTSWQLRKIFFVIWGIPMLLLMLIILIEYYRRNFFNTILLGLPEYFNPKRSAEKDVFYSSKNIPTILLTTIMFVINTFFAHINVSSRLNSSNPIIYWYGAYSMSKTLDRNSKESGDSTKLSLKNHWIIFYFVFYVITGCVVFTNFYLFV